MSTPANTELTDHFDRLLDLFLERKATDEQVLELRSLAEQFGDRFQAKFDSVINSEITGEGMTEQTRQEILTNIFNRTVKTQNVASRERSIWKWMAAAAAITVFAIGAWYFTTSNQQPTTSNQTLSVVEAEPGPMIYSGKRYVKLDDGSVVLMTENSQLTVSEDFNTKTRTVSLIGKAYFDIAHNPDKKFEIITGDVTTTVLGTAFSIDARESAQSGKSFVSVVVTRGKVQVGDKDHVYGLLTRNQQMVVNLETKKFETSTTDAEAVTAWKRNYLAFENVTMEVAAAIIKEKYNVNVLYSNESIKHCDFTATFIDGESIEQVMEVISTLVHVEYEILPDGNVMLKGDGCKPAQD